MKALLTRLAKLLLKLALDRALEQGLPKVYERIDAEMPALVGAKATPLQVTGLIASAVADVTGKRATGEQVEAVIGLYSPVAAALRNLQR